MTDFPAKSQDYPLSLASKVLDSLSMYFLALPVESLATEVSRDIRRHRGFIEGALPVLCALSTMTFTNEKLSDDGLIVKVKVSRKARQRNRQKPRASVDRSLFVKLGVIVPHTREAATLLSISILAKLKEALSVSIYTLFPAFSLIVSHKFYLSLLRRSEFAGDIKALLLPNVGEPTKGAAPEVSSTEDVESTTHRPSVYPMVQPMKAAFHFNNANGFGGWRILISTEAHKSLREFHRADEKVFKIIVKKIKFSF
jgi:hypothetical protein